MKIKQLKRELKRGWYIHYKDFGIGANIKDNRHKPIYNYFWFTDRSKHYISFNELKEKIKHNTIIIMSEYRQFLYGGQDNL